MELLLLSRIHQRFFKSPVNVPKNVILFSKPQREVDLWNDNSGTHDPFPSFPYESGSPATLSGQDPGKAELLRQCLDWPRTQSDTSPKVIAGKRRKIIKAYLNGNSANRWSNPMQGRFGKTDNPCDKPAGIRLGKIGIALTAGFPPKELWYPL